jgi:hypothetical protein
MTEWSNRQRDSDAEWRMVREQAGSVACPEPGCEARVGECCRNLSSGEDLARFPAHARRIRAADESIETPRVSGSSDAHATNTRPPVTEPVPAPLRAVQGNSGPNQENP